MANKDGPKFEEELANLEAVVAQIDSGELTLEESIDAFERGVGLVRSLNQKLDEFDRRVELLTRGPNGELRVAPYQGGDASTTDNASDDEEFEE
jgi:exodeoxyribonuclease VII small subunit